jgi:N-acetylmuramoyl-L-alanine amidase
MTKPFAGLKKFALLLALCLASCLSPTHAAFIIGQSYVPLADWARANGLKCFCLKRGDEVVATNRTTRLIFDKDSRMVEVNGTDVALSFPVAGDHGALRVAQTDINTAIRPLLFPSRFTDTKRITTICLDPGHGGKDTGNHTFWRSEKTYTLALALELRDQLQKAGFNVILTRSKDTYVELPDRPALANRRGADLFVSLHFNATPTGKNEVEGPQTYCITPVGASSTDAQGEGANFGPAVANRCEDKSLLLAYQVQKSLVRNLGAKDRGVRRARFAVLRDAAMPAILIEGGYMTHPAESKKIYDAVYRHQMAQSIVIGILTYQRLVSPPPSTSPATNRPVVKNPTVTGPGTNKNSTKNHTRQARTI